LRREGEFQIGADLLKERSSNLALGTVIGKLRIESMGSGSVDAGAGIDTGCIKSQREPVGSRWPIIVDRCRVLTHLAEEPGKSTYGKM
jgi:hypothetical protein